jgi:pyrroline-5-carboxylate reductase
MPNLAASVGEGVIMYCGEGVTEDELAAFRGALAGAGILFPIGEELIDAGTALSGCAPAYAFMFAEALAEGGVRCGLSPEDAAVLAAQTMLGAAKMIQESTQTPHELTVAVCSPGGMTIEGVQYLEASTFAEDTAMAVVKAWEKAAKL